MREKALSHTTAVILGVIGLFTLFSIFLGFSGRQNLLIDITAFPGRFLFKSFYWSSFYVPLYFFFCTFLLLKRFFRPDILGFLTFTIIPFLTVSLLFRVLYEDSADGIIQWIVNSFGREGGVLILIFLVPLEFVLIFSINGKFFLKSSYSVENGNETTKNVGGTDTRRSEFLTGLLDRPEGSGETPFSINLPEVPQLRELKSVKIAQINVQDDELGELEPVEEYSRYLSEPEFQPFVEEDTAEDEGYPAAGEFPVEEALKSQAEKQGSGERTVPYRVPAEKLLNEYPDGQYWQIDEGTRKAADVLKNTLEEFRITAEVTGIRKGPVITMFEILPAPGVKLSKIVNLADNIALRLAAASVRIVAPIPGKHAVGIEVPNKRRAIVSFREMIEADAFKSGNMEMPVVLGKDIPGEAQIIDLTQTPHLLIAGATGSGKSVCVNSIICSLLYHKSPQEVRLLLVDPKIVELKHYNEIPHLLTPVVTEPKKAFQALQYCIYEMERRYSLLDALCVRDIRAYNKKVKEKSLATLPLPYIVIIIDEFADLMATTGKELESTLARLAAMSRAVGLHLVLATQRPSIDVITGLIKANIPSRIAFMVASKFDSRIIIDCVGAEKLLGRGDMLFTSAWDPFPLRMQGAYLSEDEVGRMVEYVKTLGKPDYIDDEIFFDSEDEEDDFFLSSEAGDPLMDKALEIVIKAGKASASYLQRRLQIGYNRAARLVEEMESKGIVGPQNGSKPRDLIHVPDEFKG
ncbi:MAG: DNA translocase FtsK [Spirochaetota bacterium]